MKARGQIDNKAVEKIAELDHDLEQMRKMQPQMKCESRLSIGGTKGAWLVWSRISGLISGLSWGSLGPAWTGRDDPIADIEVERAHFYRTRRELSQILTVEEYTERSD